jgi:hypothetical protein
MSNRTSATFVVICVASLLTASCETPANGDTPHEPAKTQTAHSKGVVRVLVDLSNSFAPFDDVKGRQIEVLFEAIAKHIMRNWSLHGTFSVHSIDASAVTAPPLCPSIEFNSGGLLHASSVDLPKLTSACARLVKARSQSPAKASDRKNAINIAASSFANDSQTTHLLVIVSDFVDTGASAVTLDSLRGINVLMVYAPEKTATNSNDYLGRITNWQQTFLKQGAVDVRKLQLMTATETDVLSQLPDRNQ